MAKVEMKAPIIDELKDNLDGAKAVVLVDYLGLTVAEDTELRKKLREAGCIYKVYKNTYVKRAIEGTEFAPLAAKLDGPTAVAFCKTDAAIPAKVLAEFAKTAEHLSLKGGVVDGTYYDEKGIQVIATIPSREVLLGRLLGSMKSPITNFARVLKQIAEKDGEVA